MVNMPNVLGMRLEDALAECRAQGVEPEIVMTLPPKGREQGTIRVIRAKEGVLTVSRFEDELSPVVHEIKAMRGLPGGSLRISF